MKGRLVLVGSMHLDWSNVWSRGPALSGRKVSCFANKYRIVKYGTYKHSYYFYKYENESDEKAGVVPADGDALRYWMRCTIHNGLNLCDKYGTELISTKYDWEE